MAKKTEETKQGKRVSDIFPAEKFYPEAPKVNIADLLGKEIKFVDARIIEDFDTKYGKHDMVLMAFTDGETAEIATTVCSGIVVLKKMRKLILNQEFPIYGTITHEVSYYDII